MKKNISDILKNSQYKSYTKFSKKIIDFISFDINSRVENGKLIELNNNFVLLEKLDWDSEFFGINCGKIEYINISNQDLAEQLIENSIETAKNLNIKHLMIRIPFEYTKVRRVLENKNFNIVDGINFFIKECNRKEFLKPNNVMIKKFNNDNSEEIIGIINQTNFSTRFRNDPILNVEEKKIRKIYKNWFLNDIKKKNELFTIFYKKKIVGILSIKENKMFNNLTGLKTGKISLIIINPEFQNKNIANETLYIYLNKFNRYDFLEANTQVINYSAINLYSKFNFKLKANKLTYVREIK